MSTASSLSAATRTDDHTLQRYAIAAILTLVMAATRIHHFGPVPDASWAVFFIAGFYLKDSVRWAFAWLMIEAVLVDFYVIHGQGISFWDHYCVSAAYWFLVPAYLTLWIGGAIFRTRYRGVHVREIGWLALSFVLALSVSYLISNGSFYWISDSVPAPRSMSAWLANLADWYLPYLLTQSIYVAIAAALHIIVVQARKSLPQHARIAQR